MEKKTTELWDEHVKLKEFMRKRARAYLEITGMPLPNITPEIERWAHCFKLVYTSQDPLTKSITFEIPFEVFDWTEDEFKTVASQRKDAINTIKEFKAKIRNLAGDYWIDHNQIS